MKDDDHKPGAGADDEDATQLRGSETDVDGDATQLRGAPAPADDDRTMVRSGPDLQRTQILPTVGPVETADSGAVDILVQKSERQPAEGEEDATIIRGDGHTDDSVDDEEPTEYRISDDGSGLAETSDPSDSGLDAEDDEDATVVRSDAVGGRAEDFSQTTIRPGMEAADEDRTEMRDDEDATEVNPTTRSMPSVGRASLDPAESAPRPQGRLDDDQVDDEDATVQAFRERPSPGEDATYMRGALAETQSDATRMRAPNMPSDDDITVTAADFSDEDATVQAFNDAPDDDDATVPAARTLISDDDATVQATGAPPGRTPTGPSVSDHDSTLPASSRSMPPPQPVSRAPRTVGPGTVLKGRFTLEDKLGAGGMGGVFKAVDLVKKEARDRNPYVAVKVLNEAFAEHEDSFLALQRESSRSQRLTHPNIAAVYDFDRDGDTAYMVMELLEGSPLDSYLKKNREGLEPEQARNVIRDIAAALAYAHTQTPALVHSDFKPGNIFFTDEGAAKVFDFGIARAATGQSDDVIKNEGPIDVDAMGDDDGEDGTLFDAGKLGALTPAYAAVEMFEGRDPAPQDDVYALGIVAYQCLTGKHPFNRQKAPVAAAQEIVPERPDGVTTREWKAIRRALEFKREDRTLDAQAFLDEFFYTGTKTFLAVAATAATMAVGVGLLYVTGVIAPADPTADPNQDWVALESQIDVPRATVLDELQGAVFTTNDEFVAWEGVIRRNIGAWEDVAAPTIVLDTTYPSEAAALAEQDRIFKRSGETISVAVRAPARAGGAWKLTAGPFRYDDDQEVEATVTAGDTAWQDRLSYDAFKLALDELAIPYTIAEDDERIAAARDQALTVYLQEFDRRLPVERPTRLRPKVRQGETYIADVDPDPSNEATKKLLEEGGFWVVDPGEQATLASVQARIRAAGMDSNNEDALRGPSVLARAMSYFPTRPEDIEAARVRARELHGSWGAPIAGAQSLASQYQTNYARSIQTFANEQAKQTERDQVAAARRDGGFVELSYTFEEFGFTEPQAFEREEESEEILRDDNGDPVGGVAFPGVFAVFSRQCNQPNRVRAALDDFPELTESERRQALRYLTDCMVAKLEKDTEEILDSKAILLAAVEHAPIRKIERPDPCGALGYVGAGRNAFCRDTWSDGAAPPVVIIDGEGADANFAIGKYEVSIAEFNAFAEATRRNMLPGPSRRPATGVSFDDARAFADWLSRKTGRTYRLPTKGEWRHAASAAGDRLDPNRNCYSNVRGVIRGDALVNVGQGAPNAWGLVNHVGNVEEWVTLVKNGSEVELVGGRHTDPIAICTIATERPDSGAPDVGKGFRVLREIDRIELGASEIARAR